jgi:hypothetical protein
MRQPKLIALSLLALLPNLTLLLASGPALAAGGVIEFDRIEENTLYFKASEGKSSLKPVKTELYDLKYLGPLRNPAALGTDTESSPGESYFMFSGRPCKNCLHDSGIYAIRATGGKPSAFVYPGKIIDSKSRSVVLESRAFFGRCLARKSEPAYVVFQKERIDRRHGMQSSVFIATPGEDHMDERLIERHLPRLQDTLRLVKTKACREIEGRHRQTLRKPLDLNLRRGTDSDDADDDDDNEDGKNGDKTAEVLTRAKKRWQAAKHRLPPSTQRARAI